MSTSDINLFLSKYLKYLTIPTGRRQWYLLGGEGEDTGLEPWNCRGSGCDWGSPWGPFYFLHLLLQSLLSTSRRYLRHQVGEGGQHLFSLHLLPQLTPGSARPFFTNLTIDSSNVVIYHKSSVALTLIGPVPSSIVEIFFFEYCQNYFCLIFRRLQWNLVNVKTIKVQLYVHHD